MCRLISFAFLATLAFVACSNPSEEPPTATPLSDQDVLSFSLIAPPEARGGEVIRLKVAVSNLSDELVVLYTGVPWINFTLMDPDGTTIWPKLEGWGAARIHHAFAPGQNLEFGYLPEARALVDESGQPLPPGDYVVQGYFHQSDDAFETEPAVLTILP